MPKATILDRLVKQLNTREFGDVVNNIKNIKGITARDRKKLIDDIRKTEMRLRLDDEYRLVGPYRCIKGYTDTWNNLGELFRRGKKYEASGINPEGPTVRIGDWDVEPDFFMEHFIPLD